MDQLKLSSIILIITGVLALIGFIFIVFAITESENSLATITNPPRTSLSTSLSTNLASNDILSEETSKLTCIGPGPLQSTPPPSFNRISSKSSSMQPLSNKIIPVSYIHPVQQSNKLRSLKTPISPNHWLSDAFYGSNNFFCMYPYYGSIKDDGLIFAWPTSKHEFQSSNYIIPWGPTIKLSSVGHKSVDILDIDALVGTVSWQYQTGSMTIPLIKGSPYITAQIDNIQTSLECNFPFKLESYDNNKIHVLRINESTGYAIFLPEPLMVTISFDIVVIPQFTGVIRIGYFGSEDILNILLNYYETYPVESTIVADTKLSDDNSSWNVDYSFNWTTQNMSSSSTNKELLMVALPHHALTNIIYQSNPIDHPLIGPFRYVVTNKNIWNMVDAVANYKFAYPKLSPDNTAIMIPIWAHEIKMVSNNMNLSKSGNLSNLILIGDMLGQDINPYRTILEKELKSIPTKGIFGYDSTWGGIINLDGLTDCSGNNNAFYKSHVEEYGYIIFAYAVAGYFNQAFIDTYREDALYFVRDIANPCELDKSFPLWRNKDWYTGYSISSGLYEGKLGGKDGCDIAEAVAAYYSVYLLSTVLNHDNLKRWSLAMLASEISAGQHYFQQDDITVTSRGDNYYTYMDKYSVESLIPLLKPINLMSFDYIKESWLNNVSPTNIEGEYSNEAIGYALLMYNKSLSKPEAINTIVSNHSTINSCPWTSILYWILYH